MAAGNANWKRSISTILRKNGRLWTVYAFPVTNNEHAIIFYKKGAFFFTLVQQKMFPHTDNKLQKGLPVSKLIEYMTVWLLSTA